MADDQSLVVGWLQAESTWQQQFHGWDFSQLTTNGRILFNMSEEQLGWDYTNIICQTVEKLADSSDDIYLLDLGTGGGEYLDTILSKLSTTRKKLVIYATESYQPNFLLAKERLMSHGVIVIYTNEDSLDSLLPFSDDEIKFDLIISRHTCYNIREVERLLKDGSGMFITQQVDGTSSQDLIELFDHQPKWPFFNLDYACQTLKSQAQRMKLIRAEESETKLVFKDINALIIYLHAVPWMVEDFSVLKYQHVLLKLYHSRQQALEFNSKYMLLQAIRE
ncbi:hypothetical protein I4U23_015442 [Adineta vaga]|nr:hypothetical protein I4U23_015442 [Adineta vaga]